VFTLQYLTGYNQRLTSAELQRVWRMRNPMASAHRADKRHSKYATGIFCACGDGAKPTHKVL